MSDDPVFRMHRAGKISVTPSVDVSDAQSVAMAYTPGVARVCTAIADIGPAAAMPVMEGKSLLFKRFANVDAVPIVLNTTDTDQIVATVAAIAPSFGGINLADISAPRCFEIEDRLRAGDAGAGGGHGRGRGKRKGARGRGERGADRRVGTCSL